MLRYRIITLAITLYISHIATAQELFVYTEPASNMPAKSTGIRISNWLMDDSYDRRINYHLIPEIMWGATNKLMLHAEGYISNTNGFRAEGVGFYAKYRFFSQDKVYRHFRMAAFARAATNNNDIHQEEIAVNGHNTGYQLGLIGTQLLHKTALSATVYYEHVYDNLGNNEIPATSASNALNYSLSAGRLLWPRHYINYKQTNVNLMAEMLGQSQPANNRHFADLAIALQLIFNSQTRLDIGYKHEVYSNMLRTAPNGLMLRVEHLVYHFRKMV